MSNAALLFLAGLVLLLPVAGAQAAAPAASEAPAAAAPTVVWTADAAALTAMQDAPGAMPVTLFTGPASAEERDRYFPGGRTPSSVSMFLLQKDGLTILFDSGNGDRVTPAAGSLPDRIAKGLFDPASVDYIFLTHMHGDHIGGLLSDGKRAFPRARIMVAKDELDYWLALARREPGNANAALARAVATAYGEDLLPPFAFNDALPAGVEAIAATGHTPGHTVFKVTAAGRSLLILGDLLHAAALQFPLPEECATFDMDKAGAAAARKRILNLAAEENLPVAGMHIPFTGFGTVAKDGTGFSFTAGGNR